MENTENVNLKKNKDLPIYLRYSNFIKSNKSSLVCVLKSETYQTEEYNVKRFYKPIILGYESI